MTDGGDLPEHLARLWRVPPEPRLGRPATLDIERIVRAVATRADHEGLASVALAKVAGTLGATKMSLYRHLGSKAELLDLMADLVAGPPPDLGAVPASDWRGGVRQWAAAYRAIFGGHPWLTELRPTTPPRARTPLPGWRRCSRHCAAGAWGGRPRWGYSTSSAAMSARPASWRARSARPATRPE